MTTPLRVMVVDDTITYRMIVKKVVESLPNTEVISTASNGRVAIDRLGNQQQLNAAQMPHLVLLDVEMPVLDGLATLKEIRSRFPEVHVVMVSSASRSNANIVMECLNAGAMDFVTKPMETDVSKAREALIHDLDPILTLIASKHTEELPSEAKPIPSVQPLANRQSVPLRSTLRTASPISSFSPASPILSPLAGLSGKLTVDFKPDLLLIGSSTGGPAALGKVLSGFGKKLPIPTLIVQHMPPVFTASLAAQLSRISGLTVEESEEGMMVEPGRIILAMGGKHLTIKSQKSQLVVNMNEGPKVNECRPAVDVLFLSVMSQFSGHVLAVILTGMGRDGAKGVEALKRGGKTYCITQDQASCVVYGMPRSVEEVGLSDESISLSDIGKRVAQLCFQDS
ncbi:MAG: chemotaxis-specific protein-glutamate methyltransferase CheB [Magnetococcus sp. DMHC-6]